MKRALLILVVLVPVSACSADATKPNVIIFLCDDVGWGEFGFQGAKDIPTPHIDSIARNGVRFTQGYVSAPVCSPTRAGLLTGRYQTRFGHEFNSSGEVSGLSLNETTMADRLKTLGYATICVGKWHLGMKPEFRPWRRGFDEFYGTLDNTPYFHPTNFIDSRVSRDIQKVEDNSFFTTEKYGDRAVEFIDQHKSTSWLLYLPFNAQHSPLEAPQKYLDRFPKQQVARRRVFSASLSAMDDVVGKVMEKVRQIGEEENTLIFFLSDNGGQIIQNTSVNDPLRGTKATVLEGGIRVPFAVQWKGRIKPGQTFDQPIIQLDILPTVMAALGENISNVDGVNLLPYLTGQAKGKPHETLYWRLGSQWAIRDGDWKLVAILPPGTTPKLYHLATDISEMRDQAASHPQKVKELLTKYQAWNAKQVPPAVPSRSPVKGTWPYIEF